MDGSLHLRGGLSLFFSPNKIELGLGASRVVGAEAKALGCTHALVVVDPAVVRTAAYAPIETSLEAEGVSFTLFAGVEPETPARVVDEGARLARDRRADLVVGVGGGTTLDTAKGISLLATNSGSVLDYEGIDRVPCRGLPKIMIPTTAGSGSEATRVFAVRQGDRRRQQVVYSTFNLADVCILDPLLTLTLPPLVTAESGLDALAHAVEAYTSRNATALSDLLALETIRLVGKSLVSAYENGADTTARSDLLLAATLAGLSFSSAGLGAGHALAFELEAHGLSHARGVAVMLPHVMDYNLPATVRRLASIAGALGENTRGLSDEQAAERAVAAVRLRLERLGIASRLGDHGLSPNDVPAMVEGAARQSGLLGNNARDAGADEIRAIYLRGFS